MGTKLVRGTLGVNGLIRVLETAYKPQRNGKNHCPANIKLGGTFKVSWLDKCADWNGYAQLLFNREFAKISEYRHFHIAKVSVVPSFCLTSARMKKASCV